MTEKNSQITIAIIGTFFVFLPSCIFAAEMNFRVLPNTVVGDSATIIEVSLDPEGKDINAVDGLIKVESKNGAKISTLHVGTGGSALALWQQSPTYLPEEGLLKFAGGTPVSFSEKTTLFRMRVFADSPGQVTFSRVSGNAYLDDGEGTQDPVSAKSLTVSLGKSVPNPINPSSPDSTPPQFESIEFGSNPDVFDGKRFVSISATDNTSGVDRFEVTEKGVVTTVTDGVYVLGDQEQNNQLFITVYDKAGNSTSIKFPNMTPWYRYGVAISIIVIVFLLLFRKKILRLLLSKTM